MDSHRHYIRNKYIKYMKNIKDKDFEKIMTVPLRDIQFLMHQIVSTMRKLSRDGKLEDYIFAFLHNDIDLIFKDLDKPKNKKQK